MTEIAAVAATVEAEPARPTPRQVERRELDAISFREGVTRVLIVMVVVALVASGTGVWLAGRNAANTIALCELQNRSRLTLAGIKRDRVDKVLHGPRYAERRESLLDEARALEQTSREANCTLRFEFP